MRLPRFRLRTLLVLVLLAGAGTGGYVLWGRSAEFRRRAAEAERLRQSYEGDAGRYRYLAEQARTARGLSERVEGLSGDVRKLADRLTKTFPVIKPDPTSQKHLDEISRLAAENQLLEDAVRRSVGAGREESPWARNEENLWRDAARAEKTAKYYAVIQAKYGRAARYPWLPVAPDPPEPD